MFILLLLLAGVSGSPAAGPVFVGMGDSIGEGVQSADASFFTQPYSYLHLLALRAGLPFQLPWIVTTPFSSVGDTETRFRAEPGVPALNLAVSGADVSSLLHERADGILDSETDLVLMPRKGSQIEIAESLRPAYIACWIGNNDALGAVTSFDNLDASQLTSLPDFTRDFTAIADRLNATGAKVVFGTIPDVTRIAFLVPRDVVLAVLGSAYGLAPGDRTSIAALILIQIGVLPAEVLNDPNFILTAQEAGIISARIGSFNGVINSVAGTRGMGVADIYGRFEDMAASPPVFFARPLHTWYLGGLFSLDGVHPSNIAHALIANEFIETFNTVHGAGFAPLDQPVLDFFFLTDPFVDKDHDGRVSGRPLVGLLETLAWILGISGDPNDLEPGAPAAEAPGSLPPFVGSLGPGSSARFLNAFAALTGRRLEPLSLKQRLDEFRRIFGLSRLRS